MLDIGKKNLVFAGLFSVSASTDSEAFLEPFVVAEVVVKKCPVKMAMVGQQDTFGESGKPDELKAKYGMTAADIVKAVKGLK